MSQEDMAEIRERLARLERQSTITSYALRSLDLRVWGLLVPSAGRTAQYLVEEVT